MKYPVTMDRIVTPDKRLSAAELFEKNRFIVVKNFLQPPLLQIAHRYALMKLQNGQIPHGDGQVPGTPSLYGDTLMESIMEVSLPHVEHLSGHRLYPTYAYFRVYRNGDSLKPHIDRPSCEISFSICLGYDIGNLQVENYCWPIYVDNSRDYRRSPEQSLSKPQPGEGRAILLNPGDCVIYRGCEVKHWRDRFRGKHQAQAFIHYVDRDGPYTRYRFDTRPKLGAPADAIQDNGPYEFFTDESPE